jgi:hypothetical protein
MMVFAGSRSQKFLGPNFEGSKMVIFDIDVFRPCPLEKTPQGKRGIKVQEKRDTPNRYFCVSKFRGLSD